MLLRDYQENLFRKTVESFRSGHRRPLVVAPCGAGKSYLFVAMIKATQGEVLILTHRRELKEQHERLLEEMGVTNARVAMVITEANHMGEYPTPRLIIADEAHLSRSHSWEAVINHYDTYTVGLTATPVRLDGKPLGYIFDDLIEEVDARWLIDHHRLSPYEYYAPTAVDTSDLRSISGDFVLRDLDQLMNDRAIYGNVIDSYNRFAPGEKTIAFCVSVSAAVTTAEAFQHVGINAVAISANTPEKRRERIMDEFRTGAIQILCNVGIISEGISIDDVTCCLMLRPTESIALGIQQMMRCMRYLPGKVAKIIDCVGNYTRIGLPDDPRQWSLTEPVKRKRELNDNGDFYIRCCPNCYLTFATAPVCPYCGEPYPLHPREIAAHEEIELEKITAEENEKVLAAKKKARAEQGRASTFEQLVQLGIQRGYKNPAYWAAKVMRGRR